MPPDDANEGQEVTQQETPSSPAETQVSEVEAIMAFDPFGPAEEKPAAEAGQDDTGTTETPGEGSEEAVEGEKPKDPDPKAAAAEAQPPTQQGPTKREQELEAQVASLTRLIQQAQQPQQTQQPKAEEKAPENKYNLGLPPQIVNGLRSEDDAEFATAMHAVVNGIANKLWNDFQEHLNKEVVPQIDQRVQVVTQHGHEVQRVHNEFYGDYPHLKNPVVMPIVQRAAMQVAQHWQMQGKPVQWNKEFANDVATLVHQVVPAPQPQTPPAQPKPKTFTSQPGSRPAAPAANEFADVL